MEEKTYCSNCGKSIPLDSKFCNYCGTETSKLPNNENNRRKIEYEGKIHKCPNCGEIIKSLTTSCSSCGFEFRDSFSSETIRDFYDKLESINDVSGKNKGNSMLMFSSNKTKEQVKINLIRNFPVPNNKEDIYEFMVLAASNIDLDIYGLGNNKGTIAESRKAISNAWKSKMEQVYRKATILFDKDPFLEEIQKIYLTTNNKIEKEKNKQALFWVLVIIGFLVLLFVIIKFLPRKSEAEKRNEYLEEIVLDIEDNVRRGKCEKARNKAYTLVFDEELDKEKHEYWVRKKQDVLEMINEACK